MITWPDLKQSLVESFAMLPRTVIATGFRVRRNVLEYDEKPMLTILSIATNRGDYEFEIVQALKQQGVAVCLIVIDPNVDESTFRRFQAVVDELYVNPQLDGFTMLRFDRLRLPLHTFTTFDHLLWRNVTHPNVIFGSNLQWGLAHPTRVRDRRHAPVLLDYRSDTFQRDLQGFKPVGDSAWQKRILKTNTRDDPEVHTVSDAVLSNLAANRKIWRFYKKIPHPAQIPAVIVRRVGMDEKETPLLQHGMMRSADKAPTRIESLAGLLQFFHR